MLPEAAATRQRPPNGPSWLQPISDPGPDALFDFAVYIRGAMTLHALRGEIGDADFYDLVETWAFDNAGGNVTTADFIALAESVSGDELGVAVRDTGRRRPVGRRHWPPAPEPYDDAVDDVALLDAGGAGRLERFGAHVVDRPHPGALAERRDPGAWQSAHLRFDRDGGWSGPAEAAGAAGWEVGFAGLRLTLRTTAAGQVGLFPEHGAMLPWLRDRAAERTSGGPAVTVLHLFAYTGLATLALAAAGVAVAHVDASRPAIAWARENASRNGLEAAAVRWLVDDVAAFVAREIRRGRHYDGVILDPPTYGHGGSGQPWHLERDLAGLLADVARLLPPDGFVLLTAHTPGVDGDRLADALGRFRGRVEAGDLFLHAESGARLELGAYARLDGAA